MSKQRSVWVRALWLAKESISTNTRLFAVIAMLGLASPIHAQNWEPVTGDELRDLFSDTTLRATLGGGNEAVATYNADGSGQLTAWGDTFPREWRLDGDELVCIKIDGVFQCFRVQRNPDKADEYRGTLLSSGEIVVFTVGDQEAEISQPVDTDSGSTTQPSAAEMAQKLANPTNPIMTIGNNFDFVTFQGDLADAQEQSSFRYVFQTVFPFKLRDGKGTVFFRPAIPVFFDEPVPDGLGGYDDQGIDIGDIGFDFSYGQTNDSGWIYGAGVAGTIPSATNDLLGKDLWGLGPEALFGKINDWGVLLGLATHQWDIGGSGDGNINVSSFTYVYAFNLGGGWQLAASPVITYDHDARSDDRLSLPLGIGLARTAIIKGRPWKFQVQYWNYVEGNDAFSPEHQIRISISPVVSAPWNAGK